MVADSKFRQPVCFVAMPFGSKSMFDGSEIDFDVLYAEVIEPAISSAGMTALRADEEQAGGIIHKLMFERLVLSDYVVADLTTASANVFYELGVRHAVRPYSTVLIAAAGSRLPFDVAPARTVLYELNGATTSNSAAASDAIATALEQSKAGQVDSPVFQLVEGFGPPNIERLRTDVFRDRVEYSTQLKSRLRVARDEKDPLAALDELRRDLGEITGIEAGIVVDLFLSYRDAKAYDQMVDLVSGMPPVVARTPLVREQLGFALNRLGRRQEAIDVLHGLIKERGPSSETLGILGRVHKDLWQEATKNGKKFEANGHLQNAIQTYLRGFESDWRDAYPGINAVTLMELAEPPDPRRRRLAPVVVYSAQRRIEGGDADYWDYATVFEAAVLADDRQAAEQALQGALAIKSVPWEVETTQNNLQLIIDARAARDQLQPWYEDLNAALLDAM